MSERKDIPTPKPLPPFGYWEYYQELDYLNPTSPETLLNIGKTCGLNSSSRVLDVGSGKGTVAILWAQEFGCPVVGVDDLPRMVIESRRRAAEAGLQDRIVFRNMDASDIDTQFREPFDLVCSFGSMFIWGYQEGLQRLIHLITPGGYLVFSDLVFTDRNIDPEFLRRAGYTRDEYPTMLELHDHLNILGWEAIKTWEATPKEWQYYLDGTTRALKWYNNLHPGIINPFVESEKEWVACIRETGDKWVRFVHVVAKERRQV
jgi:cyclopropane fatty-acyl-phospholipid synthase-like methyltransferase